MERRQTPLNTKTDVRVVLNSVQIQNGKNFQNIGYSIAILTINFYYYSLNGIVYSLKSFDDYMSCS